MAPGVRPSGPAGNFSINGAVSFENLFLVNGVTLNENVRGTAPDLYIEDAVQETAATAFGTGSPGNAGGVTLNASTCDPDARRHAGAPARSTHSRRRRFRVNWDYAIFGLATSRFAWTTPQSARIASACGSRGSPVAPARQTTTTGGFRPLVACTGRVLWN